MKRLIFAIAVLIFSAWACQVHAQVTCSQDCAVDIGKPFTVLFEASISQVTGYRLRIDGMPFGADIAPAPGTITVPNVMVSTNGDHFLTVGSLKDDLETAAPALRLIASTPPPPPPADTCDNFLSTNPVSVLVTKFDVAFVRGSPHGMRVEWNLGSLATITKIEFGLLDDGEPEETLVPRDGRYNYGTFFKPVRDGGPFPLVVRAWDSNGGFGEAICRPGVTVSSVQ